MFDYTDGTPAILKARIWQVIFEQESRSGLNSDIQFDVGYMNGEDFVKTGNKVRHLRTQRTLDMLQVIQGAGSVPAIKQDLESYLVQELEEDPDVEPEPE